MALAYERALKETGHSSYEYVVLAVREKMEREGHYKEPKKTQLKLAVDNRGRVLRDLEPEPEPEQKRPLRRRRRG